MLIEKDYRRNRNGDITKRTIVEIQCDKCGTRWESAWSNRKRKLVEQDLCARCRNKRPWVKGETFDITCSNCGKVKNRPLSLLKDGPKFCSLSCRDEHNVKSNYGHLFESFKTNPNEAAYLFGLILGDGHLKKHAKRTTRVSIAFDINGKWGRLLHVAKNIFDKLRIQWFEEPRSHKNCQMIGFVLPDDLLAQYGMLFSGNKLSAQPSPSPDIITNINYAAGLLNSDGWYIKNDRRESYGFNNTVASIADSFSKCLSTNNIHHTRFEQAGRFDLRTQRTNKRQYQIDMATAKAIKQIHDMCIFPTKGKLI